MVTTRQIREWMDAQVDAYKIMRKGLWIDEENDLLLRNIGILNNGIHLSSDEFRYVAQALDLDIYVRSREEEVKEYPYELHFIYKDTVFYDIETEEYYKEHGAVV